MAEEKQNHSGGLFPVAFYNDLHPDFSVNFQMNRCYNFSNDDEMLHEMRVVSPLIHNYGEFIKEFLRLYEKSLQGGHKIRAAHYLRTSRLFTRKETAQNHCQLGNVGLSVKAIVNWVEQMGSCTDEE
jgi:hypothetical protein